MTKRSLICFPHKPSSVGGPGTFQNNLESYLKKNGCDITYPESKLKPDLIFVVAGTRKILWLMFMKFKRVKILHRLDGMNWKFKYEKTSILSKSKQIIQNFLIFLIRNFLADHIVYQSNFIESWWVKEYGKKSNSSIIVNGSSFHKESKEFFSIEEEITLTCVEGAIQSDNVTRAILSKLDNNFSSMKGINSIEIFGDYSQFKDTDLFKNISFQGSLKRESMKTTLKNKKRIFLLLELNPPCPNSMIEALCLGIPCIGFNSGSFEELLDGAGIVLPYNTDVWKLEPPNMEHLIEAVNNVSTNYEELSKKAYEISSQYDLNIMCHKYLNIIHKLIH